jgi:thiamine kinase
VDADAGELLAGGYRNAVRRRRVGRQFFIDKQYAEDDGPPNPMYPNLPGSEAAALRVLGPSGLAPEFVAAPPGGVTYRYVAGPMWRPGRHAAIQDVARLLHRVHTTAPPAELRRLHHTAAQAAAHGDEMLADIADISDIADVAGPDSPAGVVRTIRPASPCTDAPRRPALVHTDCGPGNIVRARTGPVLIDWQCPGVGDAVEDLVCFLSPAMMILYDCRPHSAAAVAAFLEAYPDRDVVARHRRDATAWHYRIASYCAWRAVSLAEANPVVAERYRRALAAEVEHVTAGRVGG